MSVATHSSDTRSEPPPLRLLFFASCSHCGVTALLCEEALAIHAQLGNQLTCVADVGEQFAGLIARLEAAGVRLDIIPGLDTHRSPALLSSRVAALLEQYRPHIVHVQSNWQAVVVAMARRKASVKPKIVYSLHAYRNASPIGRYVAQVLIGTMLLVVADKVIVSSPSVYRSFRWLGGRLSLQLLGVEQRIIEHAIMPDLTRQHRTVVYPAAFRAGKNQEMAIRAAASYIRHTGDRNWTLLLPGDGTRLAKCKRLATALDCDSVVVFPGHLGRTELLDIMLRSQVAVICSSSETFGHCIAEALALGRIVLTRNVGCAEQLVVDGTNGFLFRTEDDLVDLFRRILPHIESYGDIAKQALCVRRELCWRKVASAYLEDLASLPLAP